MDFPTGLLEAVRKYDPAGFLFGASLSNNQGTFDQEPSEEERRRLLPLMKSSLQGKRILNLAGGADKLVPYKCGELFLTWLKKSAARGGWFGEGNITVEDIVFEGVGHALSPGMAEELNRFVVETLKQLLPEPVEKTSRM